MDSEGEGAFPSSVLWIVALIAENGIRGIRRNAERMELLKLYNAILRRRWALIESVVFFTIAAAVAALALPKTYQATAKVMVSSSDTTSALLSGLGLSELALGLSGASEDIANHIALATSRPVLEEVVWRLQLRDSDGDLLVADKLLIPGLDGELLSAPFVEVKQQQGTDLILVTANADSAELAQLMADTLARVYISETQDRARSETTKAGDFVKEHLVIVQQEFDKALADIADLQEEQQIIDLESEVRSAVARLSELLMSAEENAARIREVRAQIGELRGIQAEENIDLISPATVAANPDIRALRETIMTLRLQREATLQDKTERHPDVLRIDAQIRASGEALALMMEEQHTLDPSVLKLRTELAGLLERGVEINDAIARTTETFSLYPDKMRQLSQLTLAASAAEEVYKALQAQSYEIAIAEALSAAPLQLVEHAALPERHASPKVLVWGVLGFAVGVLFGLGLVALFEYVDDSVKTPDDLQEIWPIGLLGTIPRVKSGESSIAGLSPTDPQVEIFRSLRSSVAFTSVDRPLRTLLVTSSLPGEGKSTVLANLGVSFAQHGKKVLIIDCDLRRPTQHKRWPGTSNRIGLSQVLLGEVSLAEAVQPTSAPGLTLLTAGASPPDPGRLVESDRLRRLLTDPAATAGYDVVLVDAPPAMVVNDALILAKSCDGLLMVVESGGTSRRVLADARDRLVGQGVQPLGLVLNKMDLGMAGYAVYQRAYKSYASASAAPPADPPAPPTDGGEA